jgi:hypothetical protein
MFGGAEQGEAVTLVAPIRGGAQPSHAPCTSIVISRKGSQSILTFNGGNTQMDSVKLTFTTAVPFPHLSPFPKFSFLVTKAFVLPVFIILSRSRQSAYFARFGRLGNQIYHFSKEKTMCCGLGALNSILPL